MGTSFPGLVVVNPYRARTVADLGFSLDGGPTGDEAVPAYDSQILGRRSSVENPPLSHILRPYDRTGVHLGLGRGSVAGDQVRP